MELTESFISDLCARLKREILASLRVSWPGAVVSYDAAAHTADIQPSIRGMDQEGHLLTAPLLRSVPVYLSDPTRTIAPGDRCMVLFSDVCLDGWIRDPQPALPACGRKHDLADAVAFVGFLPED